MENQKKIIGRLEHVDIPELNLYKIPAKIDTGAYRGAIHACNIEEIIEDGNKKLTFSIVGDDDPEQDNIDERQVYKVDTFSTKRFRSTNGSVEERYFIPLKLIIAGEEVIAQLSLTDRSNMKHPVLIGRRALKKKFLINVDRSYLND